MRSNTFEPQRVDKRPYGSTVQLALLQA